MDSLISSIPWQSLPILLLKASGAVFLCAWLYFVYWLLGFWRTHNALAAHIPGFRLFIHPHSLFAMILPRIPYFNIGEQYTWRNKADLYKAGQGAEILSMVSFFPPSQMYLVSDADAIKYIVKERWRFMKPLSIYKALGMFGMNVGITEGADWTRHRRIVTGPTFAETTNQRAWDETVKTLEACFEEWDQIKVKNAAGQDEVHVNSCVELTLKIALFTISAAAFSQRPPWKDDDATALPAGHQLTFRNALHTVLKKVFWKMALPAFAFRLPSKRLRHIGTAFTELELYLREMIAERRSSGADARESETGRKDLLGSLVHASSQASEEDEDFEQELMKRKATLTDTEVMGNIYVFLLAGHDTTAHTLAFTFVLLALYPEVQKKLLDHINSVLPAGQEPSFEDWPALTYSLAVFLETLRLYPSVVVIPKYAMRNSAIPIQRKVDEKLQREQVAIPAGGEIFLNAVALHYSERHWGPDASNFRPERFMDSEDYTWPRDAFLGFSAGPRACLGQKFAQIEAVAIITHIIRKYEVLLKEDVDGTAPKNETREQKRERVTRAKTVITLTPEHIPVVFRER